MCFEGKSIECTSFVSVQCPQCWDCRSMLLYQALPGFWGSKVQPSCVWNNHMTTELSPPQLLFTVTCLHVWGSASWRQSVWQRLFIWQQKMRGKWKTWGLWLSNAFLFSDPHRLAKPHFLKSAFKIVPCNTVILYPNHSMLYLAPNSLGACHLVQKGELRVSGPQCNLFGVSLCKFKGRGHTSIIMTQRK